MLDTVSLAGLALAPWGFWPVTVMFGCRRWNSSRSPVNVSLQAPACPKL
jgi:hypothetical protein